MSKFDQASGARLFLLFGFVGGYCDAASYLLSGAFTGHVTGNTVLSAISLASGKDRAAVLQLSAVAFFLAGTALALLFEFKPAKSSPSTAIRINFFTEAILIAAAAHVLWHRLPACRALSLACLCLALGLQNGTVGKINGISVHTTFITGLLTKILKSGAKDVKKAPTAWQRLHSIVRDTQFKTLLTLAVAFSAGAVAGAFATEELKAIALLFPSALVLMLAIFAKAPKVERISPKQ